MDRVLIDKYQKQFNDYSVAMDGYLINKIGLIRQKTYLKIDDYFMSCVPAQIGMQGASVVTILSPKEIEFFSSIETRKKTLHFSFINHLYPSEITLYAHIDISNIKVLNPKTNQVIIQISYRTVPMDYKEIMIDLFLSLEESKTHFEQDLPLKSWNKLLAVQVDNRAFINFNSTKAAALLLSASPSTLIISSDNELEKESQVSVELTRKPYQLVLKGLVEDVLQGLGNEYLYRIKLEYSAGFTDLLSSMYELKKAAEKESQAAHEFDDAN